MGQYPSISSERTNAEKPVTEDLLKDLRDSADYNNEHGVRCGTDTVAVRLAFARGTVELDYTGSAADVALTGTVTFATAGHADDGNPNFSAAPRVTFGYEMEYSGVYENWYATDGIYAWSAVCTAISSTAFSYRVQFKNDASTQIHGYLHWTAYGAVTSGE